VLGNPALDAQMAAQRQAQEAADAARAEQERQQAQAQIDAQQQAATAAQQAAADTAAQQVAALKAQNETTRAALEKSLSDVKAAPPPVPTADTSKDELALRRQRDLARRGRTSTILSGGLDTNAARPYSGRVLGG
jgi:regulator of protease activity HflC (stomatin/prohibitin superfamily)